MKAKKRDGIRQRGNSWLVDITINGTRRTATCSTHEEAQLIRAQLEVELRGKQQDQAKATGWTLQQAYDTTADMRWANTKNEGKAKACAKEAMVFFGSDQVMDGITTNEIDDYVKHLRKRGNSAATINRKLASLSAMFTDAVERGGCIKKPRIIRQPEPTHRVRYLSPEEELMLLSLMKQWGQPACYDAIIVLVDTGMRVGELLAMQVKDIDLRENIISIWQNKGDLPRSVPMTIRVREIIEQRCSRSRGLVFFDLGRETLRYYWDRARSAMDLDEDDQFVPHSLRHTCATRLVQAGVSLFVVQKILGHSSITVTERYSHLSQRDLRSAIDVLQGTCIPNQQRVAEPRNIVAEGEESKVHA